MIPVPRDSHPGKGAAFRFEGASGVGSMEDWNEGKGPFVKMWSMGLDHGSSFRELTYAERGVFVSLLMYIGRTSRDGSIRAGPDVPLNTTQLCAAIGGTPQQLGNALRRLRAKNIIACDATGCLFVPRWAAWQSIRAGRRRDRSTTSAPTQTPNRGKAVAKVRTQEREVQNKEVQRKELESFPPHSSPFLPSPPECDTPKGVCPGDKLIKGEEYLTEEQTQREKERQLQELRDRYPGEVL